MADASLLKHDVRIVRGECQDGVPWSVIYIGVFAHFHCWGWKALDLREEQADQLAAMVSLVTSTECMDVVRQVREY